MAVHPERDRSIGVAKPSADSPDVHPMGCDTEEGGEEDDFPFIMDIVTARALFDFLKNRGVVCLSKLAYGEYMPFYGENGMRSSVVETNTEEVLSRQMRELSEELRKAKREHKTEKD